MGPFLIVDPAPGMKLPAIARHPGRNVMPNGEELVSRQLTNSKSLSDRARLNVASNSMISILHPYPAILSNDLDSVNLMRPFRVGYNDPIQNRGEEPALMKRTIVMLALTLIPRLIFAQELDLKSLEGESWFGLYFNGQKAGYASENVVMREDGRVAVDLEARFMLQQMGIQQDLSIKECRIYGVDGSLEQVDSETAGMAPGPPMEFHGKVEGDKLILESSVGGSDRKDVLPKPRESISDVLKYRKLLDQAKDLGPVSGPRVLRCFDVQPLTDIFEDIPLLRHELPLDSKHLSIRTYRFEPMYQQEIPATSVVTGQTRQVLNGVETTVFEVRTEQEMMGTKLTSKTLVAEDGTVLEDVLAGVMTMRLEPKEVATSVDYSNDVVVANAAYLAEPLADPRTRESLYLRIEGPLDHLNLFNDGRQQIVSDGESAEFTGHQMAAADIPAMTLPITDATAAEWLAPTTFVQSDDPKIIEKAQEILDGEKDAFKAVTKLCAWVDTHVQNTYTATLSNSLDVLATMKGDCTEHSMLFIGLARAAGIPAREVAGLIYVDSPKPGFYFHQWAKVWIGEWIDVDPTFGQPLADATHIKLAEGDLFEQAQVIPLIGKLHIEVVAPE